MPPKQLLAVEPALVAYRRAFEDCIAYLWARVLIVMLYIRHLRYTSLIIAASLGAPSARLDAGEPDKLVELAIPLNPDGTYSLRAFCRVCNEKLKSGYPLDRIEDRDIPLTSQNKRLLALAKLAGIDTRLEPTRLVLWLPSPNCETGRSEQRRKVEKMLHVPPGTWPDDLGLALPKGFDGNAPCILFVHGLHSSSP